MKRITLACMLFLFVAVAYSFSEEKTEKETIRKSLHFTGSENSRRLLVDNISGSVNVTGYDGNEVEVVVHKTIRAESSDQLQEAKENVTLEMTEDGGRIRIYVDAPWRGKDGCINNRGWDYYGYEVQYDFELRVPSKVHVVLKTVNDGDITVKNIQGHFEVSNVNGDVAMKEIAGSGSATTVNGDVTLTFTKNPDEPSSFKTINGKVDVEFQKNLSADLKLSTMNGEAYTDFSVKDVPRTSPAYKKKGRKNVFKSGDSFTVQTGGGPELSFATLNGNIYIVSNEH